MRVLKSVSWQGVHYWKLHAILDRWNPATRPTAMHLAPTRKNVLPAPHVTSAPLVPTSAPLVPHCLASRDQTSSSLRRRHWQCTRASIRNNFESIRLNQPGSHVAMLPWLLIVLPSAHQCLALGSPSPQSTQVGQAMWPHSPHEGNQVADSSQSNIENELI